MAPIGYQQRRRGMGKAENLRKTKTEIRPAHTLKIGCVKETKNGSILIESFCGKLMSLTQKCVLGSIAPNDVVQITQDAPGYLTGTKVVKISKNIFGTVEKINNEIVSIGVDMLQDNRRVLVITRDKYESYLKPSLHQRIRLYRDEMGYLCIEPV